MAFCKKTALFILFTIIISSVSANPIRHIYEKLQTEPTEFLIDSVVIVFLLSIGGILAGLTIGLMSLDEVNLELLAKCGSPQDKIYAAKIIPIRKDGYFLLVSLLLANTIINETLPIIADHILGNGWEAILISTFLLLVFAELIPQAACTRHGLMIGAKFVWLVRLLMLILYPIAFPIARILEHFLGKHERGFFKRAELKELIKIMGETKIDLTSDEVIIIGGVLEMRDKTLRDIYKPLDEVFMVSYEAELDKSLLKTILKRGFSRIPVFKGERSNILGMIMVKNLLEVDLAEKTYIKDLKLSNIPKFPLDHSPFAIFNEFRQGRSHLGLVESVVDGVRVSIGIITLEDLLEELLQQEIIDETDEKTIETRNIPIQATLQSYLAHGMKNSSETSGKSIATEPLSPKDEAFIKHKSIIAEIIRSFRSV